MGYEHVIEGQTAPLIDSLLDGDSHRAAALVKLFSKRGGYILSPGCEIPPEAKPENVAGMVSAALITINGNE